jgi:hypothetical protein
MKALQGLFHQPGVLRRKSKSAVALERLKRYTSGPPPIAEPPQAVPAPRPASSRFLAKVGASAVCSTCNGGQQWLAQRLRRPCPICGWPEYGPLE